MNYTVEEIRKITGANFLNEEVKPSTIHSIYFDTRRGVSGASGLFLAIDGKNADGHAYIKHAYKNLGTRNFLISKKVAISEFPGANFLLTKNVISALQQLAINHRKKFHYPVLGITGSNGKTIVKEWLYQLCAEKYRIVRSPASYNSQIGVPLSILKMNEEYELGIFEAGVSGKGDMDSLASVIQPEIGIFTNIGSAHQAGFSSIAQKVEEKAQLFNHVSKLIYCRDHELIHKTLKEHQADLISWSTKSDKVKYKVRYSAGIITINGQDYPLPYDDDISRENATHAIVAAIELNVQPIKSESLAALKMRLEMKQGEHNCFLINDAYSSDFEALTSALKVLEQQQKRKQNSLILAPLEETSLSDEEVAIKVSEIIAEHDVQKVITVGEQLSELKIQGEFQRFKDTDHLLQALDSLDFQNENILIKGARSFSLEQVFNRLSIKVHQTILEIDLEAMRQNLMVFRSLLDEHTKLMVVLKASGYGSGGKELSRFLSYQRVDYIAVAYIDEGVELRKAGIETPIMVMNPEESGFSSLMQYRLEPEIYSINQLKNFITYVRPDDVFPIHLKIETGMHRLGLEQENLEELCQILNSNSTVEVATIFSHLVASDDPNLDTFSERQAREYLDAYEFITARVGYRPIKHILNSTGISRFRHLQLDMVRLGKGLHGISNDPDIAAQLQKVQTLKTRVAQIKYLKAGETVGYNRKYVAPGDRRIATVNLGYADGLPRNAGNEKYKVLVNGKDAALIVGNVCMDMCMLDVSEIDCKEGDEVLIFGKEWPIEKLAEVCQTIPLEILTRLAGRVHRVFLRE